VEFCALLFESSLQDILDLTESMLGANDEELFCMGVQFIETLANNYSSMCYDDAVIEKILVLIRDYVCAYIL